MKVKDLINNIKTIKFDKNLLEKSVKDIKIDSAQVQEGDIFIALKGQNFDGNDFVMQAYENGASVIVSENKLELKNALQVEDARKFYALVCKNFFGRVCDKLKIIAVTGTNGKTTITHLIANILGKSEKVGQIGTLGVQYGGKVIDSGMTTPDPYFLHKSFKDMFDSGCRTVVMEASAHAIYLKKLEGIKFDIAIMTNITEDHLDYFKSMSNYALAKARLFLECEVRYAILCGDDKFCRAVKKYAKCKSVSYGIKNGDALAINIKKDFCGTEFELTLDGEKEKFKTNLIGEYNIQNALASILACREVGLSIQEIKKRLSEVKEPEGRFNVIRNGDVNIVIDFAHTPDGVEKILKTARDISKEKLIVVFGCGGNRDKKKRPIMGQIASKYADEVVITSDNPRWENPMDIINEIKKGATKNCKIIENRQEAVEYALQNYKNGTIIIAGKGAEKYQEIRGVKIPYSDFEVVDKLIKKDTK